MLRKQIQGGIYLRPELTGCLKAEDGWQGEWHEHPFDELIYLWQGTFFLECAGSERYMGSGTAVLIPAGVRHRFFCSASDSCMLYIGASCRYHEVPMKLLSTGCEPIDCPQTLAVLHRAAELFCGAPDENRSALPAAVFAQLTPVWERFSLPLHTEDEEAAIAVRIQAYLEEHISEKIMLEKLAASFYLSQKTMCAAFQRAAGLSIKQYHSRLRMEKAMLLLRNSDLHISEISDMLGFGTVQYFSSCFRACYGVSPRMVREQPAENP